MRTSRARNSKLPNFDRTKKFELPSEKDMAGEILYILHSFCIPELRFSVMRKWETLISAGDIYVYFQNRIQSQIAKFTVAKYQSSRAINININKQKYMKKFIFTKCAKGIYRFFHYLKS